MNWLSQMILTEIDLKKMYPADKPREYKKERVGNRGNYLTLLKANARRENEGTARVLKALGNEALTSRQLSERLGGIKRDTLDSKLRRMVEYGYIERYVPPSGQGITYKVIK